MLTEKVFSDLIINNKFNVTLGVQMKTTTYITLLISSENDEEGGV